MSMIKFKQNVKENKNKMALTFLHVAIFINRPKIAQCVRRTLCVAFINHLCVWCVHVHLVWHRLVVSVKQKFRIEIPVLFLCSVLIFFWLTKLFCCHICLTHNKFYADRISDRSKYHWWASLFEHDLNKWPQHNTMKT